MTKFWSPSQCLRQEKRDKDAAKHREAAHDEEGKRLPESAKCGNLRGNDPADSTEKRAGADRFAPVLRLVQMDSEAKARLTTLALI